MKVSLSSSPLRPSPAKDVEIKSGKEVDHSEENDDNEEKFRMVVKRMANAFWLESISCVCRMPKIWRVSHKAIGKKFPLCYGIRRH